MATIKDLRYILGTPLDFGTNDRYSGTAANDFVYLYGGNDVFIDIDDGNDTVFDISAFPGGRSGNDVVSTGIGDDTVASSLDSANSYYGGIGNDSISVGASLSGCRVDLAFGTAQNSAFGLNTTIAGFENIYGSNYNDVLYGDGLANIINGFLGENLIDGRAGNDTITGGNDVDRLHGGADNDRINGLGGNDYVYGEAGNDVINGNAGNDRTSGGLGNDTVLDQAGNDTLYGDAGNDFIRGGDDNDLLFGGADNDEMYGQNGGDTLEGGAGVDQLYGGAGLDRFVFRSVNDSLPGNNWDTIHDFVHGADIIDVSFIDANTSIVGNQAFTFRGNVASFTGAGQIRTQYLSGTDEKAVYFNTDGDQAAEMVLYVSGNIALTAADFIL